MISIVVDANVVVAGMRSGGGPARQVIRGCLLGEYEPLFGPALLAEYEHALLGPRLPNSLASERERQELLAALASVGRWVKVYYLWRPNLRDETDNHLVELAVAGGAAAIVTHNVRDFREAAPRFGLRVLLPRELLKELEQ